MIERKIIISMITSTDYLKEIRKLWNSRFLQSSASKRIAKWCVDYFDEYGTAPGKNIESIFYNKVKQDNLPEEIAEEFEEDILPNLSDEYEEQGINVSYMITETKKHFTEQRLKLHQQEVKELLDSGQIEEAERLQLNYDPAIQDKTDEIDLSTEQALDRIETAFTTSLEPVIHYPKALGEIWNNEMVKGGLVALQAIEKAGKTFMLLDMAMRTSKQGKKVAFFQAGDMTEAQQIRRIGVYRTKKPYKEEYLDIKYEPVADCVLNQLDECDKFQRECDFGIFGKHEFTDAEELKKNVTKQDLIEKFKEYSKEYKPCFNCVDFKNKCLGTPYIRKFKSKGLLEVNSAKKAFKEFFIKNKRRFMISSHANDTLSVKQIKSILNDWDRQDNFQPDLIVVDYADLLIEPGVKDFRHMQNSIWKQLRGLSQERHCLVVTATQSDSKAYEQDKMSRKNFSEDKRKYAHVTAIYSLHRDKDDREKELGVVRIGELMVRESDFSIKREVKVLQMLSHGQPYLTSFW